LSLAVHQLVSTEDTLNLARFYQDSDFGFRVIVAILSPMRLKGVLSLTARLPKGCLLAALEDIFAGGPSAMKRVPALDGLRAVAILFVIFFHASALQFVGGYIGVDIFFVLSGYLITSILLNEHERTGRISLHRFYFRRVLRLAPALSLLLFAYLSLAALSSGHLSEEAIKASSAALFFAMNWMQAFGLMGLNPIAHTWSLAVEEQFYLLWPALLIFLLSVFDKKRIAVIAIGLALLVACWRALLTLQDFPVHRTYFAFDTRADGLLIGCMLALASSVSVSNFAARSWIFPALILGVIAATSPYNAPWMYMGGFLLVALCSAWLIAALISSQSNLLQMLLSCAPLLFLGRISYGMYLWHVFFVSIALHSHVSIRILMIAIVPVTVVAASLSYFLVELPFLRLKGNMDHKVAPLGTLEHGRHTEVLIGKRPKRILANAGYRGQNARRLWPGV
jgi:peptidoglycan/LPS O-acetylase OafA/YrhL